MKRKSIFLYIGIFLHLLGLLIYIVYLKKPAAPMTNLPVAPNTAGAPATSSALITAPTSTPAKSPAPDTPLAATTTPDEPVVLGLPVNNALARVTKKPFGIKVSPQDSPVSPERFSGYHTGVDFEILPGEEKTEVAVSAICEGSILAKRRVGGYGGVLVQACELDNQEVTVLYGHLALASIKPGAGDTLKAGDLIGNLGAGASYDTDGERKHLHLSIHRGAKIDYRGYVQSPAELSAWLDYLKLIK